MDPLKILVFNWRCWLNPQMGGAEVFTREVLKEWAENGHEVTLFTSRYEGCKDHEIVDGVRIIRKGGKYSVYWEAWQSYKNSFINKGFDVVIDEINTVPFFTPKYIRNGEKIVVLIHQLAREYWLYETPFPINYLGYSFLEERWLRDYTKFLTITVSDSTKSDLTALGFNRVSVVGEGLNFETVQRVTEKKDHPVIIYSGRLKKAKRPNHAIEAFKTLKKDIPKAELWIIGDGYYTHELMKDAPKDVTFFGNLSNEQRRSLIKKGWVLVNPSVREGFGLNIIEANALSVPCVAYNVPGLRDSVVDGETGILVKSGNVQELAEAASHILTNKDLRLKLSQKAIDYSQKFSWNKVADKFINTIMEANNG